MKARRISGQPGGRTVSELAPKLATQTPGPGDDERHRDREAEVTARRDPHQAPVGGIHLRHRAVHLVGDPDVAAVKRQYLPWLGFCGRRRVFPVPCSGGPRSIRRSARPEPLRAENSPTLKGCKDRKRMPSDVRKREASSLRAIVSKIILALA
jgi:hypothetical protein